MPEKTKEIPDRGKILQNWSFPEFKQPERGRAWYVWVIIISLSALTWSIITANYLFTLIIILVGIIFIFQNKKTPGKIECQIKEEGVEVGRSFYAFEDIKNFWIVYRPPEIKVLYFDFKGMMKPTLPVSLENQNPLEVREILKKYIEEDLEKEEEPSADSITRTLKL